MKTLAEEILAFNNRYPGTRDQDVEVPAGVWERLVSLALGAQPRHTPGPLNVFIGNANGRGLIRIETDANCKDGAGVHVASLTRTKTNEAYAMKMVRAFNAHDELRAALADVMRDVPQCPHEPTPETCRWCAARAALAKAEGP